MPYCSICGGSGKLHINVTGNPTIDFKTCQSCKGTGHPVNTLIMAHKTWAAEFERIFNNKTNMKKTFNNRQNSEAKKIENSLHSQSSGKNLDKEILKKKGIISPDIKAMPFRVKEGKTIRFFKTKAKYDNYMKHKIQ